MILVWIKNWHNIISFVIQFGTVNLRASMQELFCVCLNIQIHHYVCLDQ